MDTSELIRHYGEKPKALSALKISRQLWDYWTDKGIPEGWQYKIQIITKGKLKAKPKAKRA